MSANGSPSTTSQACSTSRTRSIGEQRAEDLLVQHRRAGRQVGGDRRRAEPAAAAGTAPHARRSVPCRAASCGVAVDPLLRGAARSPAARRCRASRPGRRRARGPRPRRARSADRRSPRGRAPATPPSTSGRRTRTPRRRSPGTASSRSASESTITQFLPPELGDDALEVALAGAVSAAARTISQADRQRAGERDRRHARGARTSAAPTSPSPGSSESAAGGTPPARSACDEPSAQPGRLLGGLEHDGVAGRERRRGHPARDREREVPGRDHRDHAARARSCSSLRSPGTCSSGRPVLELDRAAGVVLEEVDRLADVGVGLGPRLGALADLERGELEPALAQPGRRADERRRPVLGAERRATRGTRAPPPRPRAETSLSVARAATATTSSGSPGSVETQLLAGALVGADHHRHAQRQRPGQAGERVLELRADGRAAQLEHRLVGERWKRWHTPTDVNRPGPGEGGATARRLVRAVVLVRRPRGAVAVRAGSGDSRLGGSAASARLGRCGLGRRPACRSSAALVARPASGVCGAGHRVRGRSLGSGRPDAGGCGSGSGGSPLGSLRRRLRGSGSWARPGPASRARRSAGSAAGAVHAPAAGASSRLVRPPGLGLADGPVRRLACEARSAPPARSWRRRPDR